MGAISGETGKPVEHFDAVVVGSGFGGAVSAYRLAAAGKSVCVLERGKSYPPGSFPRAPHDLARNFWDPSEGLQGMFDVWSFSGIRAVVSSGLGGGSLIYANVLLRKDPSWFVHQPMPDGGLEHWPISYEDLEPHYDAVEKMMKVQKYPIDKKPYDKTYKTHALREAAAALGIEWKRPNLAVTFGNDAEKPVPGEEIQEEEPNIHELPRSTCRLVGECDIGCNFGSKNSLDYTYLSAAHHKGAEIRGRSEVRSLEPLEPGFRVNYVEHLETNEGVKTDTSMLPLKSLTCDRLVLAAGTLGTTYLMLKNRSMFPRLSPMLGRRFSGNGDFLGMIFRARRNFNGVTSPRLLNPSYGPVITSYARLADEADPGGEGRGLYIQDAGFPQFVNWMVEQGLPGQSMRLARFLLERGIARLTNSPGTRIASPLSRSLGRNMVTATSLPLLGMGRDVPDGYMCLREGFLEVDWTSKNSRPYFDRMNNTMRAIAHRLGGIYLSFLWLNLLITVHPLGGCPMGIDEQGGVIDPRGQVFGYPGLSVVDGAAMPGPVGANPSLTIAAFADHCADHTIENW